MLVYKVPGRLLERLRNFSFTPIFSFHSQGRKEINVQVGVSHFFFSFFSGPMARHKKKTKNRDAFEVVY